MRQTKALLSVAREEFVSTRQRAFLARGRCWRNFLVDAVMHRMRCLTSATRALCGVARSEMRAATDTGVRVEAFSHQHQLSPNRAPIPRYKPASQRR